MRGPKSAVHTVSQITTPEDHVHVLSVDGARVLMVAEAITEAFPEDRSFFRIANQLGKQQGYEPEKLQGTARVHCYLSVDEVGCGDGGVFGRHSLDDSVVYDGRADTQCAVF